MAEETKEPDIYEISVFFAYFCAAALALLYLGPAAASAQQAKPDYPVKEDFSTIIIKYTQTELQDSQKPKMQVRTVTEETVYIDAINDRFLIRTDSTMYAADNGTVSHSGSLYDGKNVYEIDFDSKTASIPSLPLVPRMSRAPIWKQKLQQGAGTYVRDDVIAGVPCKWGQDNEWQGCTWNWIPLAETVKRQGYQATKTAVEIKRNGPLDPGLFVLSSDIRAVKAEDLLADFNAWQASSKENEKRLEEMEKAPPPSNTSQKSEGLLTGLLSDYGRRASDGVVASTLSLAALAEKEYFDKHGSFVSCSSHSDCEDKLGQSKDAYHKINLSITVSPDGKSFAGTASHEKGTGKVFSWDSKLATK